MTLLTYSQFRVIAQLPPDSTTTTPVPEIPVVPSVENPIPVTSTPTPSSLASYGLQGLVISLIITLGRPLADKVYLMISDKAKAKNIKEDKALEAQIRQAQLQEEQQQANQKFLQEMTMRQQERHSEDIKNMSDSQKAQIDSILDTQKTQLQEVQNAINGQTQALKDLLQPITTTIVQSQAQILETQKKLLDTTVEVTNKKLETETLNAPIPITQPPRRGAKRQ